MFRSDLIKNAIAGQSLMSVAQRSGVSIDTVARARDGENLSIKSLRAIADACKLQMRDLFTFDEVANSSEQQQSETQTAV